MYRHLFLHDFAQTNCTHTDKHISTWSIRFCLFLLSPEGLTGSWHVTLIFNIGTSVDKWLRTCCRHICLCFNYPVTSHRDSLSLSSFSKLTHSSWLSKSNYFITEVFLFGHPRPCTDRENCWAYFLVTSVNTAAPQLYLATNFLAVMQHVRSTHMSRLLFEKKHTINHDMTSTCGRGVLFATFCRPSASRNFCKRRVGVCVHSSHPAMFGCRPLNRCAVCNLCHVIWWEAWVSFTSVCICDLESGPECSDAGPSRTMDEKWSAAEEGEDVGNYTGCISSS